MKQPTLLSLPLRPWSFSFGIHLALFAAILWMGRGRALDLTIIDLDLSAAAKSPDGSRQISQDEEWRKPLISLKKLVPPPPQPEVQNTPAPAVTGPASAVGAGGLEGNAEVRSIAQVSQLPHFVNQVKAKYPDEAKRANIEGVVILQVDIDAAGGVKKVDLIQGLGYGCDEAALTAVQQSTFTPALAGGEPVPVRIRIPYRFKFEY